MLRPSPPAIIALCVGILGARSARADDVPRLRWDAPVRCFKAPSGKTVRVQCDDDRHPHRCLMAPNESTDGAELRRVSECSAVTHAHAYEELVATGAELVPAVAEVPPGFARSDRGRAYQTMFDLLDRIYVGLGWAPVFERSGSGAPHPSRLPFGRAEAELGMDASVLSPHGRSRHDFQVLKGTATFGDLTFNGLVFGYDYQQLHTRPAYWLTTFFGTPRVYPMGVPLGWGFRVFDVEDRPPAARSTLDMELAEAHVSWNPWQSSDMYSRLRLEAGADTGKFWADRSLAATGFDTGRWYVGFSSAVRSRVSLGEGGLHYIFADLTYTRPTLIAEGDQPPHAVNRLKAQLAYEGVFVAINDQPISLRLAANGTARDDLPSGVRAVEIGANAGLRFSFWAPPRVFEPLPEYEDP